MPEVGTRSCCTRITPANIDQIAEVARIVHFLKKHAVGKTIQAVKTQEDNVRLVPSHLYESI